MRLILHRLLLVLMALGFWPYALILFGYNGKEMRERDLVFTSGFPATYHEQSIQSSEGKILPVGLAIDAGCVAGYLILLFRLWVRPPRGEGVTEKETQPGPAG